jgi:serine/threonine protein kinase
MTSESEVIKGRRIDRYDLQELIGEGGMGAVYRAVDSRLGRTVALKTVVPGRTGAGLTDELRERFMREALAASKVEHRNVVQVIDFGVTPDGTPYLVMEYLRGQDLGVLLRKSREPLAIEYVADVMLCVCAALRACHQLSIVHRDLKPSNIFLAETDTGHEIKVLDFGVSKAPASADLTQEGQILGTPQYLSPEQVNGKVGPESDQYALGVLLYVCLTKRLPFEEHQNLSLLRAIEVGRFRGPRAHRSDIPEALEAIVLRAMHANPAERFESVHALGQKLWSFASARGQVEWKNYYFHSPPIALPAKGTLRGIPLAPSAPQPDDEGAAVARVAASGEVEPTAILGAAAGSTEPLPDTGGSDQGEHAVSPSPQLLVSTKLARPPGIPNEPISDKFASDHRRSKRRRWLAPLTAAGVIALGLYLARGRWSERAAPIPVVPIRAAEPVAAPVRPKTSISAPIPAVEPAAASAIDPRSMREPVPPPSQKKNAARKKHTPPAKSSPKMGLDQNGIGIPSN